jgi:hypothetical protein
LPIVRYPHTPLLRPAIGLWPQIPERGRRCVVTGVTTADRKGKRPVAIPVRRSNRRRTRPGTACRAPWGIAWTKCVNFAATPDRECGCS